MALNISVGHLYCYYNRYLKRNNWWMETTVSSILQLISFPLCEILLLSQGCSSVQICTPDDRCRNAKVNELFVYDNFIRVPAEVVEAGDICCLSGIDDVLVLFLTTC